MHYLLPMVIVVSSALSVFAQQTTQEADCSFNLQAQIKKEDQAQYRFTDSCGQPFEIGYRLEGNTLYFPHGGKHTVAEKPEAEAQAILRQTYGLVDEGDNLIRTKGF